MFSRSFIILFTSWSLLFSPFSAMANSKAEKKEEKAVTESTILLIASAYTALTFAEECTSQPSVLIFAAGAIFYIFGEIKNWSNFKKASDKVIERYRLLNREENEAQVDALAKAEEQTREAESAARTRAKNAETAATMYGVAAIIAIIEGIIALPPWRIREDTCRIDQKLPDFLRPMINGIFPEAFAQADANKARQMGITSPESAAKLSGALFATYKLKDFAKNNGFVRAAFFGAYALIANEVAELTEEAADIYKAQADKYKKELDRLIAALSKIGQLQYSKKMLPLATMKKQDDLALQNAKSNCGQPKGSQSFNLDPNCSCRKTNSCKKVSMPIIKYSGFTAPKPVTDSISSFSTMASNGYASNNGEADLAQSNLLRNARAIKDYKKRLQVVAENSIEKSGNTPINFAEQERLMADKIMKSFGNSFSAKGRALFASELGAKVAPGKVNKKKVEEANNALKNQIKSLSRPIRLNKGMGKGDPLAAFLLQGELANQEALDAGSELSKYKSNDEEIHGDKKKSIFKIITNRYIKSAFPILFDED